MMKKVFLLSFIIILFVSGCASGVNQTNENTIEVESGFCLLTENVRIKLGMDISEVTMEPISTEQGSGDGFRWTINKYDNIEVKTLLTDDQKNVINKASTESPAYHTPRGIKPGDSVTKLKETYPKHLTYSQSPEKEYCVFDPEDDLGFHRIYFYIEDDSVSRIVLENGIDG